MKYVLKILTYSAISLIMAVVILAVAARLMQDKVAGVVLKSVNKSISTKIHIGSSGFSLLSRFPHASLELYDVIVSSSPTFDAAQFSGINTDTLLSAKNISVEFRITNVLRGNYNADKLRISNGKLNLFTDTAGKVNYDITAGAVPGSANYAINLDGIRLAGMRVYYNDLSARLILNSTFHNGNFKSKIRGDEISFTGTADLVISGINLNRTDIVRKIPAKGEIDLVKNREGFLFRKGILHIDNSELQVEGTISFSDIYDLKVSGRNVRLAKIVNYLPVNYYENISGYDPDGILTLDGKIKGLMTKKINPHADFVFRLEKGRFAKSGSKLTADHITFDGILSNGPKNRASTGSFRIRDLSGRMGKAEYKCSLAISDFDNPFAEISFKGKVFPSEIIEIFGVSSVREAAGSADADLKLSGRISFDRKFRFIDLARMKSEGRIGFNSMSINLENGMSFGNVTGEILFAETIRAKKTRLTYKGQTISVDGEFRNLLRWLGGDPVTLTAKADIATGKLLPEVFLARTPANTVSPKAFRLPGNLILDINFRIDSLKYKTFTSSNISGSLNYKPKLLTFKSFNMKALNGNISGNGFVLQYSNKSILSKGLFKVSGVDVNLAFKSFQNFGQNFLKAGNIAGSLSGSFSLLVPLDSMLKPQINTMMAEGKYTLLNGALINFDPVKELSSFIELSELENIHFEKMENDFFIRDNFLYIPTMEVRSSAADLSVNGKHSFDNDYEYHVKILLSEILSRKRETHKKTSSEFGEVQDDGLGRTSLLLRIVNKGSDIKVSYDMKAASAEVKKGFDSEKKKMKNILNEEYGWFSKDSSVMQKPGEKQKKAKFKVKWDDN